MRNSGKTHERGITMPRGQRRSKKEKLIDKLNEVRESIKQYESAIMTLRENESEIIDELEREELNELLETMRKMNLTTEDIVNLIEEKYSEDSEQTA